MCCRKAPLDRRAKTSATINMVLAVLNLISGSLDLRRTIAIQNDASVGEDERENARLSRFFIFVALSISSVKLVMGCLLWYGAAKRLQVYVRFWFVISILLWLITLTNYIANLLTGRFLIFSTITIGLTLVLKVFVFIRIVRFIIELDKEENGEKKKGTELSDVA